MVSTEDANATRLVEEIANLNLNDRDTSATDSGDNDRSQQHTPEVPDPLASLSNTQYAQRTRALLDINDRLRQCGLDEFISLPKIAAVGIQSSGKSSIIEAISQIKVPRDTGTCTRCPMEVRLRGPDTAEWTCTVSLNFEHDVPDEARGIFRFAFTDNKGDVEQILRYSQWMILNPNEPRRDYQALMGDMPNLRETAQSFSRNSVIVDITGSPLDITFIDLPGIFQVSNTTAAGAGEDPMIHLVRELTVSHFTDENCFILLIIHMTGDIATQESQALARQYDRHGTRRIGVLTMADRVQRGAEEQWLRILRNEDYQIRHRYYVTRLMATHQVSELSWGEGRVQEHEFFAQIPPWNTVDKNYVGVENLTKALSARLSAMIENRIPTLREYIGRELVSVRQELDRLSPPFTGCPQSNLLQLCNSFTREISKYTEGQHEFGQLFQATRRVYTNLRNAIYARRLAFDVDGVHERDQNTAAEREHGNVNVEEAEVELEQFVIPAPNQESNSLEYVRNLIQLCRNRELEGHIPWSAAEYLMRFAVSNWEELCMTSFGNIVRLLKTLVEDLVQKYFRKFRESGLEDAARNETIRILDATAENTRTLIRSYCQWEKRRPFTQNNQEFVVEKNRIYEEYVSRRQQASQQINSNSHPSTNTYRMPEDDYAVEIMTIAEVTSYFYICFKRVIDVIPMLIESEFINKFSIELTEQLIENLRLTGEGGLERCARFVVEDEQLRHQRERLERKRTTLEDAREIMRNI